MFLNNRPAFLLLWGLGMGEHRSHQPTLRPCMPFKKMARRDWAPERRPVPHVQKRGNIVREVVPGACLGARVLSGTVAIPDRLRAL